MIAKFRNVSVFLKIVLASMIAAAVGTISVTAVLFSLHMSSLSSNKDQAIRTQLQILAKNITAALVFDDGRTAQELLESFSLDSTLQDISVYDEDESLFARYEVVSISRERALSDSGTFTGYSFYAEPVMLDDTNIGRVEVIVSNRAAGEELLEFGAYAGMVLMLAMGIALLISMRLQRMIARPIIDLNNIAKRVAESNDYGLRARFDCRDEFGQLAIAFNNMLHHIESRDLMLEKQVQQRTAELEKLANEFRHRAFHDPLTGLPNRALLIEHFQIALEHANRGRSRFCLLMLDLDNFKVINDTLGHDFGDELLVHIAKRIENAVRGQDIVFRLGGDEFVVLGAGIRRESDAKVLAGHILDALTKDILVQEQRIKVTISIGGAMYPDQGDDLVAIKRNADIAMYRAKENGKNQFQMFRSQMKAAAVQRMTVQNDLRGAIRDGQLLPYFQPKVDAFHSRVVSCEVLSRWQHPDHGLLEPNNFIPFAEENGLVRLLDYYMLEQACVIARRWLENYDYSIPVAVNLSGVHFRDRNIVKVVENTLVETGLLPSLLEIELTEAVFIQDPEIALATLNELKALGVKISLDDFGIGYSSLHYLRTLPVDVVKLDKSFIQNVAINAQDRQLTKGIVSLARNLGFDVVAEGVETEEQLRELKSIDCRHMQGHYFCKPLPEPEFLDWIRDQRAHGYQIPAGQALPSDALGAEL